MDMLQDQRTTCMHTNINCAGACIMTLWTGRFTNIPIQDAYRVNILLLQCLLSCACPGPPRVVGVGGGTGDTSPSSLRPPNFMWPHEALIFIFMGCIFMLSLYFSLSSHCLYSMSECLGRIISNTFTISVDKLFDTLINWPKYMNK